MRIVRFQLESEVSFGLVEDQQVIQLAQFPGISPEPTGQVFDLKDVTLLAPVEPSKIVCAGLNYTAHAAELDQPLPTEPLVFLKPSSSIIAVGETIELPEQSSQVELEVELAMVVSQTAKNVSVEDAADYILGYTIANDVTARDLQFSDLQWARSKAFDTFCPLGPWIETDLDFSKQYVESRINGELRQREGIDKMIFTPHELFSYISQNMTLNPQDVILTGSPSGISKISSGDLVECEISGIGVLSNPVA